MNYTNHQFHTSQVLATNEAPRVVRKASMSVFVGAMALYASTLIPSHPLTKITSMAIASSLAYVSHRLDKLENMLSPYEAIAHQQSVAAYGNWLGHSMKPPARQVAIAEQSAPVKFADVKQALSKPHVMLLGSTGDGKSTLAKHLAANCTAYTIVIDPHAAPDDWGNLPVYGAGRKYEQIAEIMQVTLQLLQKRFDARDQGVKQFEPIVIICDEYPAIIASSVAGKVASSWLKLISREARKVAIRLVVLTQSPEVKAIGLEGEGSVRDNFCFIKLGEFALDHAKSLKDDAIKLAVESCDRPAMLGNLPCNIPQLSDRVVMPVIGVPADFAELTEVDKPLPIDKVSDNELTLMHQKLLEFVRRKEVVSARDVISGISDFRSIKSSEVKQYLEYLADRGYGIYQDNRFRSLE